MSLSGVKQTSKFKGVMLAYDTYATLGRHQMVFAKGACGIFVNQTSKSQ